MREKRVQNALGNVFLVQKRLQNVKKISASGGHIVIEIRLVMSLKCIFFRACGGHHSVFVFYACLQDTSTQAQNSDFLSAPATGRNHNDFVFYACLQGASRQAPNSKFWVAAANNFRGIY